MSVLVRYDAACRAIAEARAVDEVKDLRDKAEAMRVYARQAKNRTLEVDAAEIRMRAERRLGELIVAQKAGAGLGQGRRSDLVPNRNHVLKPILADSGIDKKLSSRAQKLAAVPEAQFEGMLGEWRERVQDETERVTTSLLRAGAIAQEQAAANYGTDTTDDLRSLANSGRKYGVIYADPPWSFRVYSGKGKQRSAERHYPTMTQQDICALPVSDMAADDCALFLWAVMPQLPEALEVIKAWGFEYKTVGFTWVKTYPNKPMSYFVGMGYWTRANPELCLFATRGAPRRKDMGVEQLVVAQRGGHSSKPEIVAERIARLVGGPYLEMFARRPRQGWSVWGNGVDADLLSPEMDEVA